MHQWRPVLAILRTAAVFGVEPYPVSVEVDVSDGGLPAMTMVGLPDDEGRPHDRGPRREGQTVAEHLAEAMQFRLEG